MKMDSAKGPGPDELRIKVIKEVAAPITSHLSNIFNKCIDYRIFYFNKSYQYDIIIINAHVQYKIY